MNKILILGAGRSSSSLIAYLLKEGEAHNWQIIVGDFSLQAAQDRIGDSIAGKAMQFDITNEANSIHTIAQANVVISLLPPHLHIVAAKICLQQGKHLLTASYVTDEMQMLNAEARNKQLLFLNECGLDPGIDHMSAMHVIDKIKAKGGTITSFESFTGGLISPETDPENPWRYKFTWNPRNVVMAGQSTAKFLQDGEFKYVPYQQLFKRTLAVNLKEYGAYEGYANRDSLKYIDTYGLQGIKTMLRGTLRSKGFCDAWNVLVQLGCCDDTYIIEDAATMTHRKFTDAFINGNPKRTLEEKIATQLKVNLNGVELQKLKWSGLFDEELIGLSQGTPAQILEHILNKKWKLHAEDKDMIVMWHRFIYEVNGERKEIQATLVATGDNAVHTAMAKTVGLPLGIAAKLLMEGSIAQRGVAIPTQKEIYEPILAQLKTLGIELTEEEIG